MMTFLHPSDYVIGKNRQPRDAVAAMIKSNFPDDTEYK